MRNRLYTEAFLEWLGGPDKPYEPDLNVPHCEELDRLLSELKVTEAHADLRRGRFWCVYAQPWIREPVQGKAIADSTVDILIHVFPLGGGEQVCTEGLRVMLTNEAGTACYIQGRIDHRGQVWFPDVVPGCYLGVLYRRQLADLSHIDSVAASGADAGFRKYHLADCRLSVMLERGGKGNGVLTVLTEERSLANAWVLYTFGKETGQVELKAAGRAGVWEGCCDLRQTFEDAVRGEPSFELRYKKSDPKP